MINIFHYKRRLYVTGVIMCSLVSVFLYIWSFRSTSGVFPNGMYYAFQYIYLSVLCVLEGVLYKSKQRKTYFWLTIIGALIAYCLIIKGIYSHNSLYAIEELCLSLWPIFTYVLATKIIKPNLSRSKHKYILGMGVYFVLLQMAIFIIENTLVISEFYQRDPMEITFMLVIGVFSWVVAEKKCCVERNTIVFSAFCILSFLATFWNHERILDIVRSLANPVTSSYTGDLSSGNWMGYRLNLVLNAWAGNICPFADDRFYLNLDNCSLFWIKYQRGWLPFLIALVAGCILLYCLVKMTGEYNLKKNSFEKFLLLSIMFRCALGYLAELFLISSTDVGAFLLRNPGDVLLVGLLTFLDLEKENMEKPAVKKDDNMDVVEKRCI